VFTEEMITCSLNELNTSAEFGMTIFFSRTMTIYYGKVGTLWLENIQKGRDRQTQKITRHKTKEKKTQPQKESVSEILGLKTSDHMLLSLTMISQLLILYESK
jgi:hypothetical protein